MWSTNSLWLLFGLLGFLLLCFETRSIVQSTTGLIRERKRKLLELQNENLTEQNQESMPNRQRQAMTEHLPWVLPIFVIFGSISFFAGYEYRDWQAYGQFTERRPANWEILGEYPAAHYPGMAYDLRLEDGSAVSEFVPCQDIGLHIGMKVSRAGFYRKPECNDFYGPRAYIVKEHSQAPPPKKALTPTGERSGEDRYLSAAGTSQEVCIVPNQNTTTHGQDSSQPVSWDLYLQSINLRRCQIGCHNNTWPPHNKNPVQRQALIGLGKESCSEWRPVVPPLSLPVLRLIQNGYGLFEGTASTIGTPPSKSSLASCAKLDCDAVQFASG